MQRGLLVVCGLSWTMSPRRTCQQPVETRPGPFGPTWASSEIDAPPHYPAKKPDTFKPRTCPTLWCPMAATAEHAERRGEVELFATTLFRTERPLLMGLARELPRVGEACRPGVRHRSASHNAPTLAWPGTPCPAQWAGGRAAAAALTRHKG